MGKELVICCVIVVVILIGNNITQNYSVESVDTLTKNLKKLREDIYKDQDNVNSENNKDKLSSIFEKWYECYDKLAYYIEHDELEKVGNDLDGLKSYIETNEYPEAISELDESIFILNHIEDKYKFNLKNIF